MRLKTRFIILGVIFSVFFISFKMIEPELEGSRGSGHAPVDSDDGGQHYDGKSKDVFSDEKLKRSVERYVNKYAVDWNVTVAGSLWNVPVQWINAREIHPEIAPEIG